MTNAEARFNKSLRPRKPEGSLGRTAQDVHLDSHTAPELWSLDKTAVFLYRRNADRIFLSVTFSETVGAILLGWGCRPICGYHFPCGRKEGRKELGFKRLVNYDGYINVHESNNWLAFADCRKQLRYVFGSVQVCGVQAIIIFGLTFIRLEPRLANVTWLPFRVVNNTGPSTAFSA